MIDCREGTGDPREVFIEEPTGADSPSSKMDRLRGPGDWWGCHSSSGNRAFDEYRADTLKRLEDEQREFRDFLARLRQAKDKAEFDQFMAERRNRPPEQASQQT